MQYYKFPDYSLNSGEDKQYVLRTSTRTTSLIDIDFCSMGSNQYVFANRTELYIGKFINSNANGEMEYSLFQNSSGQDISLLSGVANSNLRKRDCLKIINHDNANKPNAMAYIGLDKIAFFSIKGSDDPLIESYIRKIDYEHQEFESNGVDAINATQMLVDHANNLLYITYKNKIVVLDVSDIANINKLAEYSITDAGRVNNIKDFTINVESSNPVRSNLIFCLTNSQYKVYDKIIILYYDKTSKAFNQRGTHINPGCNYNTVCVKEDYLYTNNINHLDVISGQDVNRKSLGLYIFKTTDNFVSLNYIKNIPFKSYWNDTEVPLNNTDPGYLSNDAMRHYAIAGIKSDIMYVMNTSIEIEDTSDQSIVRMSQPTGPYYLASLIMYDISNPENPKNVGGNHLSYPGAARDLISTSGKTFDDYKVYILSEDPSGEKIILENGTSYTHGSSITSKIFLIDPTNVPLLQEIPVGDDLNYDVDYFSSTSSVSQNEHGRFIAIANGTAGVKIMTYSATSNEYIFLTQLRPQNLDGSNANIKKVTVYGIQSQNTYIHLLAFGDKQLYNYDYDRDSGSFTTYETYEYSDYIEGYSSEEIAEMEVRFASTNSTHELGSRRMLHFIIQAKLPRA